MRKALAWGMLLPRTLTPLYSSAISKTFPLSRLAMKGQQLASEEKVVYETRTDNDCELLSPSDFQAGGGETF